MQTIPPGEITFHPQSFAETSMRVFWWRGRLYRAIRGDRAHFFRHLFETGVVADLTSRGFLADSSMAPLTLDGFDVIIEHRQVPFVSYPDEWSTTMYAEAARMVLDFAEALSDWNLTLVDAHPWNILFEPGRPRPVFIDWGSIVPREGSDWQDEDLFRRFLLNPLVLMANGHGRIVRGLMTADALGVQDADLAALAPAAYRTSDVGYVERLRRAWNAAFDGGTKTAAAPDMTRGAYRASLAQLRAQVDAVAPRVRNDVDHAHGSTATARQAAVSRVLTTRRPSSVLDIGCGDGWFAKAAARLGSAVVALDVDEPSVTRLLHDVGRDQLTVLPLVMNFTRPTPARGLRAAAGLAAEDRLRCDFVLALGLLHEIALGIDHPAVGPQFVSFAHIADGLARFSRTGALVEFVSLDAPQLRPWRTSYHAATYTLDHLTAALRQSFREVTCVASYNHAHLVLCEP